MLLVVDPITTSVAFFSSIYSEIKIQSFQIFFYFGSIQKHFITYWILFCDVPGNIYAFRRVSSPELILKRSVIRSFVFSMFRVLYPSIVNNV